ncbi:MAG: 3-hydroxyacyl-CoA dehydrogenase NAD-binding domain-containing protein, partial [Planctomycetota bacterium]
TVIGAGTMGHGIAQLCAQKGFAVFLQDISEDALKKALERVNENLQKGLDKGKITADEKKATLERLRFTTSLEEASKTDLVIEAVFEDIQVKKSIFQKLDQQTPPETILASNTSSLSLTEIASFTNRPGQVIGLHFFNPPYIMKLLEIVLAHQTTNGTRQQALDLSQKLGKEAILVKDSPGFATSRLGIVLGMEAIRMLQEGVASAEDIDRAMELGYGHPMGPLKLTDLVGLDVRLAITEYLYKELGTPQFLPPPLLKKMVRAGYLGKKTGKGFSAYGEKV